MISDEVANYEAFRDALQDHVFHRLLPTAQSKTRKRRNNARKNQYKPAIQLNDAETQISELSDFVEYLAEEIFNEALPDDLRSLSYLRIKDDTALAETYSLPLTLAHVEEIMKGLPLAVTDSLLSYQMLGDESDLTRFMEPVLTTYIKTATAIPSEYNLSTSSKPEGCEICDRTQLPLTYHHLVPREMHERVLKRGWHSEWQLNKVAWLCRACHSFVHRVATNEELARSYFSIDLLLEREDIQKWASWASKIRWKAR